MKYVCLVYLVEKELETMSESEADACTDESLAYDETLRRTGQLVLAHALEPVEMATTVRVRRGKVVTTDGPFAETKEQLGGFFLIDAKDMDEACAVAARFPPARIGIIEVRPVQEMQHS